MTEQMTRAQMPTVSVSFRGGNDTVSAVASTLSSVNDLWELCNNLGRDQYRAAIPHLPVPETMPMRCVGLRKHSPMWVEVGVELASSPPAMVLSSLGIMAWCLTHPAEIAGFLPSLKRHWHQGWVEADKAEREHERFRLRAERTGMRVHAADPGGVETSEDVPHYEDLELPPFDG